MALLEFLQRKPGGLKKLAFEWQMMAISPSYTFTDKDPDIRRFASGWGCKLAPLKHLFELRDKPSAALSHNVTVRTLR